MKLPRPKDAEQHCACSAKWISPGKDQEANGWVTAGAVVKTLLHFNGAGCVFGNRGAGSAVSCFFANE